MSGKVQAILYGCFVGVLAAACSFGVLCFFEILFSIKYVTWFRGVLALVLFITSILVMLYADVLDSRAKLSRRYRSKLTI